MKITFVDLVFVCLVVFVIAGSIALAATNPKRLEAACTKLSEEINRPTQYRNGACYVELCDGYWVREEDVIYSLDVCEEE